MTYSVLLAALAYVAAAAAGRAVGICHGGQRFVWVVALAAATVVPAFLAIGARSTSEQLSPAEFDARAQSGTLARPASNDANDASAISAFRIRMLIGGANVARLNRAMTEADPYVRGAWLLVSGMLLALYIGAAARLRLRSRRWREDELDGERVLVSPDLGPAVVGVVSPRIVIPDWTRSLGRCARRYVLRHEDEHIRARDPQVLFAAALLLLLCPWNPALWFIVDRLRLAIEVDCDGRVLLDGDESREYGTLLLTVCARQAAAWPLAAALAEHAPHLERRLIAMTAEPPRRPTLASVGCGALALSTVMIACGAPRPAPLRSAPHYVNGVLTLQEVKVSGYLAAEQSREVILGDTVRARRHGSPTPVADPPREPQKAP